MHNTNMILIASIVLHKYYTKKWHRVITVD